MRPTPIPDAEVWDGGVRRVIAAPNGDLNDPDIGPVEAIIDATEMGRRYSVRLTLEPGELDALRGGGVVWLTVLGAQIQPFAVSVAGAAGPTRQTLEVTHTSIEQEDGLQESSFDASVVGVADGQEVMFVRGCIEALEKMLSNIEGG